MDEPPAAPSGSSDPSDKVVDLPFVDLDQSDVIYEADPPAPEAFIAAEDDADGGAGLGETAASPTEPPAGAATSTSTSTSTSANPPAFPALAPSISSSTSTSGTPAASTSASAAPPPAPPIAKRIEGRALWQPIGVHDPRRKGKQNSTGVLTRNHKSDLPTMPPVWDLPCPEICSGPSPLPAALVGPNSDAKIARFVQVWLALEEGAIENARRNPRDPDAFQQHSMGMTWVQPEDGTVTDRKDFVRLPQAARTPAVQEEPCLAVSAQVWKDVLNAHTTFRAQGANRQAAIMGPMRDIFGQTFNFSAILGKFSQPYLALGEVIQPGRLPCPRTMKGLLWRLHELVFRKDLMDVERRLRVLLLTPAEEHQRVRHVFPHETYGADVLTVVGSGEVDRGLVAEGWVERYPYVLALGALMLDWAEPLPERVREALQEPKMSERQFLWLEGKIVEHYVAMLFAYFQCKALGPARRSTEV
ncbi:hypothetical protein FB107DRAFT_279942 [Schizophyllum commune]